MKVIVIVHNKVFDGQQAEALILVKNYYIRVLEFKKNSIYDNCESIYLYSSPLLVA